MLVAWLTAASKTGRSSEERRSSEEAHFHSSELSWALEMVETELGGESKGDSVLNYLKYKTATGKWMDSRALGLHFSCCNMPRKLRHTMHGSS